MHRPIVSAGPVLREHPADVRSRLERTRVILVDMPQTLREIVRGVVSNTREFELVEEEGSAATLATIRAAAASVVITGLDRSSPQRVSALLGASPNVRVLALADDGRSGAVYELRPEARPLGDISPALLRSAIRGSSR